MVAPESETERFAPLFTALIASVVHAVEAEAGRRRAPVSPRMLLALDEAANVFRFPRLPHLLTTARGNGLQLLLAYHDLGQLEHVTGGREVARTVVSNAKLRLLLPGVGDVETLRYFSELLGRTRVRQTSTTRGFTGERSTSLVGRGRGPGAGARAAAARRRARGLPVPEPAAHARTAAVLLPRQGAAAARASPSGRSS